MPKPRPLALSYPLFDRPDVESFLNELPGLSAFAISEVRASLDLLDAMDRDQRWAASAEVAA